MPTPFKPNKETIYQISYPRSGKSWFSYCIANVVDFNKPIDRAEAHYLVPHEGNEMYNIKEHSDLYCVLLLRDYNEAIISNWHIGNSPAELMKYMWFNGCHVPPKEKLRETSRKDIKNSTIDKVVGHVIDMTMGPDENTGNYPSTAEFEKEFYTVFSLLGKEHLMSFTFTEFLLRNEMFPRFNPHREMNIIESSHHNIPFNHVQTLVANDKVIVGNNFEIKTLASPIFHYHLATQLERYYTLLEYYDRVHAANPKQALLIRYEEFMEDPNTVLSKYIDFLRCNNLIDRPAEETSRKNLKSFIENLDFHRDESLKRYKKQETWNGKSVEASAARFHSKSCRPEFLREIGNTLRRKNPELFDKYLMKYHYTHLIED